MSKQWFEVVLQLSDSYRIVKTNNGYRIEELYYGTKNFQPSWLRMSCPNSALAKIILDRIKEKKIVDEMLKRDVTIERANQVIEILLENQKDVMKIVRGEGKYHFTGQNGKPVEVASCMNVALVKIKKIEKQMEQENQNDK